MNNNNFREYGIFSVRDINGTTSVINISPTTSMSSISVVLESLEARKAEFIDEMKNHRILLINNSQATIVVAWLVQAFSSSYNVIAYYSSKKCSYAHVIYSQVSRAKVGDTITVGSDPDSKEIKTVIIPSK